jgi:hypothetical protein
MNSTSTIAAVILLQVLPFALFAAESETNAPTSHTSSSSAASRAPGVSLESFHLIQDRNIFNPNRSGRTPEREYTRREERRARVESFALVGTLSYEKGYFAFFDGSSSDYRTVLKASDSIAGFTVAAVNPQQVMLQSSNHGDVALPLGMQLQRHDEGKWELAAHVDSTANGRSSAYGSSTNSGTNGLSIAGGNEEVLKRLMKQREDEGAVNPPPLADPPPAPPITAAALAAESEIVRRMMQRRLQELAK